MSVINTPADSGITDFTLEVIPLSQGDTELTAFVQRLTAVSNPGEGGSGPGAVIFVRKYQAGAFGPWYGTTPSFTIAP